MDNGLVFLRSVCQWHGENSLLYCSDAKYFRRILSHATKELLITTPVALSSFLMQYQHSWDPPFLFEMNAFKQSRLKPANLLFSEFTALSHFLSKDSTTAIKINGGPLSTKADIHRLNARTKRFLSQLGSRPVLIELPFDRMMDLIHNSESILSRGNVYPSVLYHLKQGEENNCADELIELIKSLKTFKDLQFLTHLSVSLPFPSLKNLLALMKQNIDVMRCIVIAREKSPTKLLQSLKSSENTDFVTNIDMMQLIEAFEDASKGSICRDDFFPFSLLERIQKLFNMLGYGNLSFKCHPLCIQVAILVNTNDVAHTPLTRIIDIELFLSKITVPERSTLLSNLTFYRNLSSCFKASIRADSPLKVPDILPFLTLPSNREQLETFFRRLQFIFIHNKMDVASIDATRRNCCCTGIVSSLLPNHLASSCTVGLL